MDLWQLQAVAGTHPLFFELSSYLELDELAHLADSKNTADVVLIFSEVFPLWGLFSVKEEGRHETNMNKYPIRN
ncbi:MAG: hypothetical protein O7D30_01365, partial [Rickettsia endosymbiont of Ixodes persulcatus]|nr:hypothetical protein [Rickettsia endosymbiont of Ixodes persulcatus]